MNHANDQISYKDKKKLFFFFFFINTTKNNCYFEIIGYMTTLYEDVLQTNLCD